MVELMLGLQTSLPPLPSPKLMSFALAMKESVVSLPGMFERAAFFGAAAAGDLEGQRP